MIKILIWILLHLIDTSLLLLLLLSLRLLQLLLILKYPSSMLTALVSIAVDGNDVNTGMDTNISIVTRCSDDRRMVEVVYQSMVVSILVLG